MEQLPPTIQTIQSALEPYIKPRDQVAYVRRVLALHLQSTLGQDQLQSPLSLLHATTSVLPASSDARGLHRDYLRALETNRRAKQEHESTRQQHAESNSMTGTNDATYASTTVDHIEEHIASARLEQKQRRLLVLQKYLDQLGGQPAAHPEFLDIDELFAGALPLPEVPSEVVNGFTVDTEAGKTDLKGLVTQLERVVLRAKLLLKREEQLLEQVKVRSDVLPPKISDSAKLQALNVTRTELIHWIEAELGKASPDGAEEEDENGHARVGGGDATSTQHIGANIDKMLADVKEKYSKYVEARKSLVVMVRQNPPPALLPPPSLDLSAPPAGDSSSAPTPRTYLLTPYLENLVAVSREQKGMILQKSHFNIAIAKQMKDTCQLLDHLAEESQLLPSHPMPGSAGRQAKFGTTTSIGDDLGGGGSEKLDSTSRVKPWVFAADSAKIATLETVAERVEEGQVALEGSMQTLSEIDRLLGQSRASGTSDAQEATGESASAAKDEDIWIASGPQRKGTSSRRHAEKKEGKPSRQNDVWSVLDGNLGLVGREDGA